MTTPPARAVTGDGSPVAVYLAAPPGDTAAVVAEVAPPPARVLELGAGAGRETRPLVACGYEVTAVDDSPAMLAHVTGARTVEADLFALDLGGRFDVVLAGSHLVDDADPDRRASLLAACARHVAADGVVLVERYDPDWSQDPTTYAGPVGMVEVRFEVVAHDADGVTSARLDYDLLDRSWSQTFRFVRVTTDLLDEEAGAHGLAVAGVHGEDATWVSLRPVAS
jgi:SAM-dependent methyltransferase